MDDTLSWFVRENAPALVASAAVVVGFAVLQWRRARQHEEELSFKLELLERGLSVEEIERLLRAQPVPGKTLLGQFAALSGWAKAGVLLVILMFINMSFAALIVFFESRNHPRYFPPPAAPAAPAAGAPVMPAER